MSGRCRICTANDEAALIEQLAADLWESRRDGHIDDRPWDAAGDYWQRIFRDFADAALESMRGSHAASASLIEGRPVHAT